MSRHRIFLSHTSADIKACDLLKTILESAGHEVWTFEYEGLGDVFPEQIVRQLVLSDTVICLLSKTSQEKKWISRELLEAGDQNKRIIAINIDGSNIKSDIRIILRINDIIAGHYDLKSTFERVCEKLTNDIPIRSVDPEEIRGKISSLNLEGKVVEKSDQFKKSSDHSDELFYQYYSHAFFDNTVSFPYHELFGSPVLGYDEFTEDKVLCYYEDWKPDLKEEISDYQLKMEKEKIISLNTGYDPEISIPRLTLSSITSLNNPANPNESKLYMKFGLGDYFEQRIYRELINNNDEYRRQFEEQLTVRGRNNKIDHVFWGLCGGGTWIVTADGYLAVSYRTNVEEEIGKLSYSSSGGYDRYKVKEGKQVDGTPLDSMLKEIYEEVNIDHDYLDNNRPQFRLISLGIDLNRYLIQFSYLWLSDLTREQIIGCRRNGGSGGSDEQIIFFIYFDEETIEYYLRNYEFEPSAAYSLMRIIQKGYCQALF